MRPHYDVVVIGAGPAGAAAAKTLAESGLNTAVFERGRYPGAKNMFGGALYSVPAQMLAPAFWESAPLERAVVSEELWMLDNDSAVRVGFTGLRYGQKPYNKVIVSRAKFDRWFAGQAVAAGAVLHSSALVTGLLSSGPNKQFCGVLLDDGSKVYGDVTIIAEGVNPFLMVKHGLARRLDADKLFLYVRENIGMAAGIIEERFNLEQNEGAIILALGFPGLGRVCKIGLFTCKESISIVVGGYLNQMVANRLNPTELLRKAKAHPLVRRYLAGGKADSFTAQLLPKGEIKAMPRLFGDGILAAGDVASMTRSRRGIDLAFLSGCLAAEAAILAKASGDLSAKQLSSYQHKINSSFFIKDMKRKPNTADYFRENQDIDFLMSKTLNRLAYEYFAIGLESDSEKMKKLIRIVKDIQPPLKSARDLYKAIKNWSI